VRRRPLTVLADASYVEEHDVAGIGVAWAKGGGVICSDIVRVDNPNTAEIIATMSACAMLAVRHAPRGLILTDSTGVIRAIAKGKHPDLCRMLEVHGYRVELAPRREIQPAHTMARQMVKAWIAGLEEEPTRTVTAYRKMAIA
jgi:hypothetical protein